MKKTILLITTLLCSTLLFAWEWEKEGDTVIIYANEKSTTVGASNDAPWFNPEYENLNIVISEGVTGINEKTFALSHNIVTVTIPSTCDSIGTEAFAGCSKLANVNLPETLKTIGDRAFYDCEKLSNVIIPGTETEVGENVFGTNFQSFDVPQTEPTTSKETLSTKPLTPSVKKENL